eukprot:m51a1_g8179 putative calcium-dependent protein kinase cdpk2a (607) ;mRNA; r:120869-123926
MADTKAPPAPATDAAQHATKPSGAKRLVVTQAPGLHRPHDPSHASHASHASQRSSASGSASRVSMSAGSRRSSAGSASGASRRPSRSSCASPPGRARTNTEEPPHSRMSARNEKRSSDEYKAKYQSEYKRRKELDRQNDTVKRLRTERDKFKDELEMSAKEVEALKRERDSLRRECENVAAAARTRMLALQRTINQLEKKEVHFEQKRHTLRKSLEMKTQDLLFLKAAALKASPHLDSPVKSSRAGSDESKSAVQTSVVNLQVPDWKGFPSGDITMTVSNLDDSTQPVVALLQRDDSVVSGELQITGIEGQTVLLTFSQKGEKVGELPLVLKDIATLSSDKWMPVSFGSGQVRIVMWPANASRMGIAYELKQQLGAGSVGVVSLAVLRATGQEVAVKAISREDLEEEGTIDDLRKEIATMRLLQHPNIVKLYDVVSTQSTVFLIMELVDGGDLYSKLKGGHVVPEKEAAQVMRQILSAVQFMHSKGVVHRDLKLENVLLTKDNVVKVSDFGFSIAINKPYGLPCDIWSLGVVLYVLLSGTLPFLGDGVREIITKVISGVFDFPGPEWAYVSSEAKDTIQKMMTRDQRFDGLGWHAAVCMLRNSQLF